jgi:recombination protein RecA
MAAKKKEKIKEKINTEDLQPTMEASIIKLSQGKLNRLSIDKISSVKEWINTGSYILDQMISRGKGLPVGKVVTITGKKGSGKSTLVAHLIKEAQKRGALTVLLDTEYAFDEDRAKKIGVDVSNLLIGQPDHIEDTLGQLERIVEIAETSKEDRLIVVVWDSVAATPTKSEIEGDLGEGGSYGEHSKVLSQGFRRIMKTLSNHRILFFIVNQIKVNLSAGTYGSDVTYIGKNPLDFHSHVMLEIKQISVEKEDEVPVAILSHVKVSKNRVGPPFKEDVIRIKFEDGLDTAWEALEIARKNQRIRLNGAWQQVVIPCPACHNREWKDERTGEVWMQSSGKIDKKECQQCEGKTQIIRDGFKQFYASNIDEYLKSHPGLEEWLVYGTGPLAIPDQPIRIEPLNE